MARINGSGFKMKSSPAKGKLSDFFSSLGKQLKRGTQRRVDKKYESAGPNVRKQMEKEGYAKPIARTPGSFSTKQKLEGNLVPNQELMSKKVKKAPKPNDAKLTFKKAFAAARKAGKKTFSFKGKSYTTELAKTKKKPLDVLNVDVSEIKKSKYLSDEHKIRLDKDQDNIRDDAQGTTSYDPNKHMSLVERWEKYLKSDKQEELNKLSQLADGSAFNKKSPYKKGIGKYTKKAKGSRGFKMKK
mgnify:CR=1 FL=1